MQIYNHPTLDRKLAYKRQMFYTHYYLFTYIYFKFLDLFASVLLDRGLAQMHVFVTFYVLLLH
jgi:hypothetical protein